MRYGLLPATIATPHLWLSGILANDEFDPFGFVEDIDTGVVNHRAIEMSGLLSKFPAIAGPVCRRLSMDNIFLHALNKRLMGRGGYGDRWWCRNFRAVRILGMVCCPRLDHVRCVEEGEVWEWVLFEL